jgi:hypothetical protein
VVEVGNFDPENVQDIRLSRTFRTAVLTDAWIKIDTISGIDASVAVIAGHNFTNAATIKIQGNDTDVWTSPTVDETMTWNADSIVHFFTEDNLRFWRFIVTDAANPDTYIEMGRLFLGTFYQVDEKPQRDFAEEIIDESRSGFSITGQAYVDIGIQRKEFSISMGTMQEATRQNILAVYASVGTHTPIFVIIDEDNLAVIPILYCLMMEALENRTIAGYVWQDRAFAFRELK